MLVEIFELSWFYLIFQDWILFSWMRESKSWSQKEGELGFDLWCDYRFHAGTETMLGVSAGNIELDPARTLGTDARFLPSCRASSLFSLFYRHVQNYGTCRVIAPRNYRLSSTHDDINEDKSPLSRLRCFIFSHLESLGLVGTLRLLGRLRYTPCLWKGEIS